MLTSLPVSSSSFFWTAPSAEGGCASRKGAITFTVEMSADWVSPPPQAVRVSAVAVTTAAARDILLRIMLFLFHFFGVGFCCHRAALCPGSVRSDRLRAGVQRAISAWLWVR